MHKGTPIKYHIAEIFSIINDLDKIGVKIEDEDQALLLLCSLPSSYKSFREVIIYGGKSTIKVNEVKEHLLNKEKIDNQLMGESQHDDSGQVHFLKEKSNNGSYTGNPKHKNLMCNWYHKKGTLELIIGLERRNNQILMSLNWLEGTKKSVMFYLLQTDLSVTKIDELLTIDAVSYTHLTLPTIYSV